MNTTAAYIRYTWFILVMVFLVILAGGIVRMTQSGMGCPDWPTCFGRWIPPTHASQLPPDFEKYLRQQDIDHSFNAYHTWIEYMNRLLGALLGLFILIHTAWSFRKFWRSHRPVFYLSFLLLLAVGFQGWLGKKVVDANLAAIKITIHMITALVIAALPVMIIAKLKPVRVLTPQSMKNLTVIALVITLIQIVMGTQVREQTDIISRSFNYAQRDLWISRLGDVFLIHRSFSWIVAAVCIYLCWRSRRTPALSGQAFVILLFLIGSFAAGLIMYFMNIPAWAQPVHLLLGSLLAISLFSFRLKMK